MPNLSPRIDHIVDVDENCNAEIVFRQASNANETVKSDPVECTYTCSITATNRFNSDGATPTVAMDCNERDLKARRIQTYVVYTALKSVPEEQADHLAAALTTRRHAGTQVPGDPTVT